MKLKLRVPATTANIGPGFDAFGLALSLFNRFEVEEAERTSVSGCEEKYSGADNLFLKALAYASELLGRKTPSVRLKIDADIPVARGLGSSAAMIVGGAAAALLLDAKRDRTVPLRAEEKAFILNAAAAVEGHPDNVSPAVYGGFCASIVKDSKGGMNLSGAGVPRLGGARPGLASVVCLRSEVAETWRFHALIPPFELSTEAARAALPANLSRGDTVFNLGRAALVALAFEKKDASALAAACEDRVHQPYRKGLIADYDEVMGACRRSGAAAAWLSGAGPTIMAFEETQRKNAAAGAEGQLAAGLKAFFASRPQSPWAQLCLSADHGGLVCGFELTETAEV